MRPKPDWVSRRAIAVFCGIGLIVSLLLATSCPDLSAGLF